MEFFINLTQAKPLLKWKVTLNFVPSRHFKLFRTRVFGKLKELLEELRELHKTELDKLELRQEEEGRQLITRMDEQIQQLITHQEQVHLYFNHRLSWRGRRRRSYHCKYRRG